MTIEYESSKGFHEGVVFLIKAGVGFKANAYLLTIELTGDY